MGVDGVLVHGIDGLMALNPMAWVTLALLVYAAFALVDGATRRADAYLAADKQKKPFWLVILGVAVLANLVLPVVFLQIAGLIATIVYVVDVRPALKEVSGGRRGGWGRGRRGGSSSDGPYGPFNR